MAEKIGRNDPCPCGSGKKYKACCLLTQKPSPSFGKRKFTAKVISSGPSEKKKQEETSFKAAVDYNTLMERSFGNAIHSQDEAPPFPTSPSQYLKEEDSSDK